MIVKFIAETDAEKIRFGGNESIEHPNVKEYFLVGTKLDEDSSLVDFHEWNGSFRYLIGTLGYFYELINDDRRNASNASKQPVIDVPTVSSKGLSITPMIKKGSGGNITPIDVSTFKIQGPPSIEMEQNEGGAVEEQFVEVTPTENDVCIEVEVDPSTAETDVEAIAEDIAKKIQKEAKEFTIKSGLKVVPNE